MPAFKLQVVSDTGKTYSISSSSDMEIQALRETVASRASCAPGNVILIYNDDTLVDGKTLLSYDITKAVTVQMRYREMAPMTIMVATESGNTHTMLITSNDTAATLAEKVASKIRIESGHEFQFSHEGVVVARNKKLFDQNIQPMDYLQINIILTGGNN